MDTQKNSWSDSKGNSKIFMVIIAFVVVGLLFFFMSPKGDKQSGQVDNMVVPKEDSSDSGVVEDMVALYQDYSEENYKSLLGNKPFVLFFHANWCSWCRRMDKDLKEQINKFPNHSVILKTDFDSEVDLRKKYEVLIKDTYVFFDAQGNVVTTKSNAALEDLIGFFESNSVNDKVVENPTGVAMYRDYDPEVKKTFEGKKKHALFFYASWCPTCQKVDKQILENFDELSSSVAIFKVDFDKELELRKELGVTTQHTLVFFDANGEVQEKISGFTLEDLTEVFNK